MLIVPRPHYKPFKYPEAHEFFLKQQQAHWLWTEVNMGPDIKDYNENLTEDEKKVVIRILRLFTTIEIDAEDYWSSNVAKWFKHPEVQQMSATNGAFESIHIAAYDHLSTSLGLPLSEYEEFLKSPAMRAKKEKLSAVLNNTESLEGKAKSLAVFSGFTEGVSLFSSFAVLMNFSRFNKLKGVANIVSWSVRDEGLHSDAGCWLFRTLMAEHPEIWTDEFKKTIYQAARDIIDLEDDYIDAVFDNAEIQGINPKQLKAYIRYRANTKLQDLGLKTNWKNIDVDSVKAITSWFDILSSGNEHSDFFALKSTAYSKGHVDWAKIKF